MALTMALTKKLEIVRCVCKEDAMKSRWSIYVLIVFFSVVVLSLAVSAVARAQSQEWDVDDDDVLGHEPPHGVDLRVFIHRPRVVKPNHLGTCTPTSDDNVDRFEVTPWRLSGPIIWSLNRSTVPSTIAGSVDGILNQSFDTWSRGVFSQGPDTKARRARFDKVNAILWRRLGRSTVGVTYAWYSRSSGAVLEVDTVFNNRYPWAIFPNSPDCQSSPAAYDLQNIATHEFGHWIGLDDLFDDAHKDLTMYGFSAGGEVKKRTLGDGDVSGKNELLP
jgi:hypothetical protein